MRRNKAITALIVGNLYLLAAASSSYSQTRNDRLYDAIVRHDVETVAVEIQSGANISSGIYIPGSDESIDLIDLAIRADNAEAALLLLDRGAPISFTDTPASFGRLIAHAAEKDMPSVIERLLQVDTSVFANMDANGHPLVQTARDGSTHSFSVLIEAFDKNVPQSAVRNSVLQMALGAATLAPPQQAVPILRRLIDAGASSMGDPFLAGGAKACRPDLAGFFIEQGHDVNESFEGRSAADYASDCLVEVESADSGLRTLMLLDENGAGVCESRFLDTLETAKSDFLSHTICRELEIDWP